MSYSDSQQPVELAPDGLGYHRIYEKFHLFLRLALLRLFDDDDYMAKPFFAGHMLSLTLGFCMIINCFLGHLDNVNMTILGLSAFFAGCEVTLKILAMAQRRKHVQAMLQTVLQDRSYRDGPIEAAICAKYERLVRKLLYVTIATYISTSLMLLMYPVVAGELDQHVLPMGFVIPFVDYRQQPWYLVNYTLQAVQMLWVSIVFIGLDGPFYLFVCYSASQLEILLVYLKQIGQNPDDDAEQRRLIRKVFEVHTRLSEFLSKCSFLYREIYFMQMLFSIGLICVSLFHVQLQLKNGSYGMLLTNVCKVWIFCFCGELVVSKSTEFAAAAYANRWYQLWNRRHLRDLLFLLANAQRTYGFSIGGFGYFSFETFTVVMKTAYTCNAFLHRIMN